MNLKEIATQKAILMRKEFPRGVFEYTLQTYAARIGVSTGKVLASIIRITEPLDTNLSEAEKVEVFLKNRNTLEQNIAKLIIELSLISSCLSLDLDTALAKELNLPTKES